MIDTTVITAAGLGTRLSPATKDKPKEMLPILVYNNKNPFLVPLVQLIFEKLYESGIRNFYFVVGRGKRAIQDHFSINYDYIDLLRKKRRLDESDYIESFYEKIKKSNIVWINQSEQRGFGDAVYQCRNLINKDFLVNAGDTLIISKHGKIYKKLFDFHQKTCSDATILALRSKTPEKYGVIMPVGNRVKYIVEKPKKPQSNIVASGVYLFNPIIFKAIEHVEEDSNNEIQLTDAISKLIEWEMEVNFLMMSKNDIRIDIGTPEDFSSALSKRLRL
ncbi:MAG: sugar phosphate nucleotidyltransferase [Candidatus Aenigmatarchaeota archaeon]